jgi:transposase-like protein
MVQARDAVDRLSWSHPQQRTGEEWWADVLADPRARKRQRRTDLAVKQEFYRLADERRDFIPGSNWDRCGVHYVEPIEGGR